MIPSQLCAYRRMGIEVQKTTPAIRVLKGSRSAQPPKCSLHKIQSGLPGQDRLCG